MTEKFSENVVVRLKPGVNDPESQVILQGLQGGVMGLPQIKGLTQTRTFILTIEAENETTAQAIAQQAAEKLLVNPILQTYQILPTLQRSETRRDR